jgi:DNA repair exonuclease SbcCD nuclease subunit
LGDLFDRRKYIDYFSLKRSREYFFDPMKDAGITMHCLVGNHDIALRNTLDINSPELLLAEYDNVKPISSPKVINVEGVDFMMLPWICSDNYAKSMSLLKEGDADVVCGHFEISGFAMYKGMQSHEGFDSGLFSRYSMVLSGHYHHRSTSGNIHYLGNPYDITWQDHNDPRGFHLFDTKKKTLKFIRNPYTIFEKIVYDDSKGTPSFDLDKFKDKFVKVIVQQKTDFYAFDQFMDKVYNSGAHDVKVMETLAEMNAEELEDGVDIEDTQTILNHYVETSEVNVDREKLSNYMKQLYVEALNTSI